jgi:phosphatidylethanolamine/phosphatidyl-N-methylethanolamine N-methyltransferase
MSSLAPQQAPIDETARFDRQAPYYDLSILPVEWVINRRRRRLLAHARGDVLEIGVGTGRTLSLYPPECRLTGVEPSEKMLERGRRRAARLGRPIDLRLMSVESLEFPADSFDTVASSLVFCSVEEPARALAEIRRVLRPGGQLLMIEHIRARDWLGRLFDRLDPWFYQQSCHLNRRTPEDVRAAGFEVVADERWLFGAFASLRATRAH